MSTSVIVPTKDRVGSLHELLQSLVQCDPLPDEAIVVDDDCIVDRGWIDAMASQLEVGDEQLGGVGGRVLARVRFDEIRSRFDEAAVEAARAGITLRVPDHLGRRRLRQRDVRRSSGTSCDRPWRELLVRWDGELDVCNMFNPFSYGVLRPPGPERNLASRFQRLWNGPNAKLFRGIVSSDEPHPYCRECYFLYP